MNNKSQRIARVLLRPDGSVHIVLPDYRTIYATAENILALFSDPADFIENQSKKHLESTIEINRRRVDIDEVRGLTLASVNEDKQIICDFPELFCWLTAEVQDPANKSRPLNMKSFEYENVLPDEKSFLLRYYFEFNNSLRSTLTIKRNIRLRDEVQFEIVKEILSTYFEEELPKTPVADDLFKKISAAKTGNMHRIGKSSDDNMISLQEYAKILGLTTQTVRNYIKANRIKSATKDSFGHYLIDRNDRPVDWDLRYKKKWKKAPNGAPHYKRVSHGSAADVEEHIKKQKLFTNAVAPYIRTFEELDYYTKRHYHEVCWDGRPALIIDVNPDYISSKTKKRNRDLMQNGHAPVIPERNKEEFVFHIHHVGQTPVSPFAIIPEYDHNGKGYSSAFHQSSPGTDLHTPEFEAQKANFWRSYLEAYDKAGRFLAIPDLNPKHKK